MDGPLEIYRLSASTSNNCFRQGEILSNVIQVRLDLASVGTAEPVVFPITHPHAVILTQDCDLEQDFAVRRGTGSQDKLLTSIFLCQVASADEVASRIRGSDIWKRIQQNKDERYQFLQKVEPGCDSLNQGIPELVIDFKKYFALPLDELYKRIEIGEAQRRCKLVSPYLEHLASRFGAFVSRVALPQDHISE